MTETASHAPNLWFCDPGAHNGERVPAEFMLRVRDRSMFSATGRPASFACCGEHLVQAYGTLNPHASEMVTIERVRSAGDAP